MALSFDGINDTVSLTAGPALRGLVNNFTIAFWALTTTTQGSMDEPQSQSGTPAVSGGRFAVTPVLGDGVYGSDDHAGVGIAIGTDGIKIQSNSYFPPLLVYKSVTERMGPRRRYQDKQPLLYVNGQWSRPVSRA
jgi:hypothetical protein